MKWQNNWSAQLLQLLQNSNKTAHSRFVTAGLAVGIIYSPWWIYDILIGTFHGAASLLLVSLSGLGVYQLWGQRAQLREMEVSSDDRWLGHLMIAMAIAAVPFCFGAEWLQKVMWMISLIGIAISCWGLPFFAKYRLSSFLVLVGFTPEPTAIAHAVWDAFTPSQMLERFMAWSGSIGLNLIGQKAIANQAYISLNNKLIFVEWGCNGFDLATIAAAASLLLGLFWKQPLWKVCLFIGMGIFFSLLSNIPRIMLMTMASVYWGDASFHFWHGFWGGQIFLSILFTVHYYAMLALLDWRPDKPKTEPKE